MKKIVGIIGLLLIASPLYAGEYNIGQKHKIVYVASNASGDAVSGLTAYLTVQRNSDGTYYDWNDSTFKSSSWTTLNTTMAYDSTGGFYSKEFNVPFSMSTVSSDYVCIVSVDNTAGTPGYGNHAVEVVNFDETNRLIRTNR